MFSTKPKIGTPTFRTSSRLFWRPRGHGPAVWTRSPPPSWARVAHRPKALDIATQIPHSAGRAYVMGDRGNRHDETTQNELFKMCRIVRATLKAGAYGFSSSRTFLHKYDQLKYPRHFCHRLRNLHLGPGAGRSGPRRVPNDLQPHLLAPRDPLNTQSDNQEQTASAL